MKKILLSLVLAVSFFGFEAKAQWAVIDPTNLVQNILTVGKTATTATNVINSFQEMQKIYNQGKEYYDKLQAVHTKERQQFEINNAERLLRNPNGEWKIPNDAPYLLDSGTNMGLKLIKISEICKALNP